MKAKIGIIIAVVVLLGGIAVYKNSQKTEQTAEKPVAEEPANEQEKVPESSEGQESEPAAEEQKPAETETAEETENLSDTEKYEAALENDLPTMLEFKTSG